MIAVVVPAYDVIRDLGNEFEAVSGCIITAVRQLRTGPFLLTMMRISPDLGPIIGREKSYTVPTRLGVKSRVGPSILFGFIGSTDTPAAELDSPANYAVNGELLEGDGNFEFIDELIALERIEDSIVEAASGSYEAICQGDEGTLGSW